MSNQYEYFVHAFDPYTVERPQNLWRRAGERWEYLSLIDWRWHEADRAAYTDPPEPAVRFPVTPERAAELELDRQGWVRYWAYYTSEERWLAGAAPVSVARRRLSPEEVRDEVFGRGDYWRRSYAIIDFISQRSSNPPHLEEITPEQADELIFAMRGVKGAIDL